MCNGWLTGVCNVVVFMSSGVFLALDAFCGWCGIYLCVSALGLLVRLDVLCGECLGFLGLGLDSCFLRCWCIWVWVFVRLLSWFSGLVVGAFVALCVLM